MYQVSSKLVAIVTIDTEVGLSDMKRGALAEVPVDVEDTPTTGSSTFVPLSLRQRKKDATHQAIADAAWALFEEQGYEETSVNDIAERANVAPRTFFRYFPSKEAVVYPEFDRMLNEVRAAFFQRPHSEPVMTSLIGAFESMSQSMTEDSAVNRKRLAIAKRSPGHSTEYVRRRLATEVEDWVTTRDADHPDVALRAKLASGMIGLIMDTCRDQWLEAGTAEAVPDLPKRCVSLVGDLLTSSSD
jgi:TetR/AcrR family transcriptional regulator, regulator of mycofactocin system